MNTQRLFKKIVNTPEELDCLRNQDDKDVCFAINNKKISLFDVSEFYRRTDLEVGNFSHKRVYVNKKYNDYLAIPFRLVNYSLAVIPLVKTENGYEYAKLTDSLKTIRVDYSLKNGYEQVAKQKFASIGATVAELKLTNLFVVNEEKHPLQPNDRRYQRVWTYAFAILENTTCKTCSYKTFVTHCSRKVYHEQLPNLINEIQ